MEIITSVFDSVNAKSEYQLWRKSDPQMKLDLKPTFFSLAKKRSAKTMLLEKRFFYIKGSRFAYKTRQNSKKHRASLDLNWVKVIIQKLEEPEDGCFFKLFIAKNKKYSEMFLEDDEEVAQWREGLRNFAVFEDFHQKYEGVEMIGEGNSGQVSCILI